MRRFFPIFNFNNYTIMNLRGNKNTSISQPEKKTRKSRKAKNQDNVSPKLKTLVEQFPNITSSITFQNENNNNITNNNKIIIKIII